MTPKTTKTVYGRYLESKSFHIYALSENGPIIAKAEKPYKYKKADMLKFTMENGETITTTLGHLFWDGQTWLSASKAYEYIQEAGLLSLQKQEIGTQEIEYTKIIKAEKVEPDNYYDFHVPIYENYAACGLWHHNTGKSLFAKAVASLLNCPLIRLDIGKILSGTVGSSEARAREAIKQIEATGFSITFLDEVEKAMAGTTSSDRTDSGVMARVFGTFLTAMQDGMKDTIIIATSNNIEQIPPEFIRRFEDVFFVDLPEDQERQDIFSIHLRKRNRKPENFDLSALSEATDRYTGAEIEKSVKRAIASKFSKTQGKEEVTTEDLVEAAETVTPISTLMGDKIKALQNWAKKHGARNASRTGAIGQVKKSKQKREESARVMDGIGKI